MTLIENVIICRFWSVQEDIRNYHAILFSCSLIHMPISSMSAGIDYLGTSVICIQFKGVSNFFWLYAQNSISHTTLTTVKSVDYGQNKMSIT